MTQRRICIIGPTPEAGYVGGVATHVKSLLKLSPFTKADLIDLGSLRSRPASEAVSILRKLISLRINVTKKEYSQIFINASLYNFSFLKALLTILVLPSKTPSGEVKKHVFFHGGCVGTFAKPAVLFGKVLTLFPCFGRTSFHFLTVQQKQKFDATFFPRDSRLFSNFADTDTPVPRANTSSDVFRILFVGRMVRSKGIYELLEAFSKLHLMHKGALRLVYVGDGEDLENLKTLSHNLPSSAVRFAGFLTPAEIETYYAFSDILVLPSYAEAFPYVVIEAMRAGLPVVASAVGALEFIVQNGVTGTKIAPKTPSAIVSAVDAMISDRPLLAAMSKNCQNYFQSNLSLSAAEIFYRRLCNEHTP